MKMDTSHLVNYLNYVFTKAVLPRYRIEKAEALQYYNSWLGQTSTNAKDFDKFLLQMCYRRYVWRYNKKYIIFTRQILADFDYANPGIWNAAHLITRYVSKNYCGICNKKLNIQDYERHISDVSHRLRLKYLSGDIQDSPKFLMTEAKRPGIPFESFKCTVNKPFQVKLRLNIQSNSPCKVLAIFSLNPYKKVVKLRVESKLPLVLGNKDFIDMTLLGSLIESGKVTYGFVINVTGDNGTCEHVYKSVNINCERSKYDQYEKPKKEKVDDDGNIIIRGIPLPETNSPFVIVNKLDLYKLPKNSETILNALLEKSKFTYQKSKQSHPQYPISFVDESYLELENYEKFLHFLLYTEENQMRKDIQIFNTRGTLENFNYKPEFYRLQVPGLAEARPSLVRGDSVYVRESETSRVKYQGIVHKVEQASVILGFDPSIRPAAIKGLQFFIEFGFSRLPIKVQHRAVDLVQKHNVKNYFFPQKRTDTVTNIQPNFFNTRLNEKQRVAVTNILNNSNNSAPYIIFGPPGTGKTSTLVEVIKQIHRIEKDSNILVCGPSNSAVDEIASRLMDLPNSQMMRFVAFSYVKSASGSKIDGIINCKDGAYYTPSIEDMMKKRILFTTAINASKLYSGAIKSDHFKYVVVDEAGYLNESETLTTLAGLLTNDENKGQVRGKFILAGDPRQLGPRVHSSFANKCGFGTSMLERLTGFCEIYHPSDNGYDERYITLLEENYRSNNAILSISNELFYNSKLKAVEDNFANMFLKWEHLPKAGFPAIFHNIQGQEARDKDSPSFYNSKEVDQLLKYLDLLLNAKVSGKQITQDDIGIITPYRKQVEKIRNKTKEKWPKLEVGSVDNFQGKERLIIIITTVRSSTEFDEFDRKFNLGFIRNPKRFNVAITRAKALLIVIGNGNILQTDICWKKYIQYCEHNKSVVGPKVIYS